MAITWSPGRPKSPSKRKSALYDACGNSLLGGIPRRPASQKKNSLERKYRQAEIPEEPKAQKSEQPSQRSKSILRAPTFREVEEKLFPGKQAGSKGKMVKSQSLDSDCRSLSPGGVFAAEPGLRLARPQTPKFGGGAGGLASDKPPKKPKQTKWLGRRAREVLLEPGSFAEGKEEEVFSETHKNEAQRKPKQFMKKLFNKQQSVNSKQ